MTARTANVIPITAPAFLFLKPFFIVNIGPPIISPFALVSRYLTASIHSLNLVERPNNAQISIHTRAPGPPENIAVATPTILPVPIVAASAVQRHANGDTSPLPLFVVLASFEVTLRIAYPRLLHVLNFTLIVINIPVPIRRTSIIGPQTMPSSLLTKSLNASTICLPTK